MGWLNSEPAIDRMSKSQFLTILGNLRGQKKFLFQAGTRWYLLVRVGGGGGIRTPETLTGLTVFKTAGFNRSPTPPLLILAYSAS